MDIEVKSTKRTKKHCIDWSCWLQCCQVERKWIYFKAQGELGQLHCLEKLVLKRQKEVWFWWVFFFYFLQAFHRYNPHCVPHTWGYASLDDTHHSQNEKERKSVISSLQLLWLQKQYISGNNHWSTYADYFTL